MKYHSTRGKHSDYSFERVVFTGLAPDGGLFIPQSIPTLPDNWQTAWRDFTFQQLALEIFSLYIDQDEISRDELRVLIDKSYSSFRAEDVTPLVKIKDDLYVLELFHGPTFAFKDVALQFLGNIFEFFLVRRNARLPSGAKPETITVVGATSGDTGSAAIYGLRGKRNISVFILYPRGKVSPIQEAQMTTVLDANVHNLVVEGTFDDCQDIVKQLFGDTEFNARHSLGAVNSINWARILAQIVYYFHSYLSLARTLSASSNYFSQKKTPPITYSVPTGNFGDILAGYYAHRMGLPASRLIVATNENDILDRFFRSNGVMERGDVTSGVRETLAPAMDITISSNFERLLWYLAHDDLKGEGYEVAAQQAGATVAGWMRSLKEAGSFTVPPAQVAAARKVFDSTRISDEQILETIRDYYRSNAYVLDPHTAIGTAAAAHLHPAGITIALATAHPAKFSAAVERSLEGEKNFSFATILPPEFDGILKRERRFIPVGEARVELVKEVMERELGRKPAKGL